MDMSLFDEAQEDLKLIRGKRDHRNKRQRDSSEDVSDLRKKANRKSKPRQNAFDEGEEE